MSEIEIKMLHGPNIKADIDINQVVADLGKIETVTKGTKKRFLRYLNAGDHAECVEIAWTKQDEIDNIIDFVRKYEIKG